MEDNILIQCENLVKIYKTEETEVMALDGLELTVKAGELLAIIGKSGSGKSTLLNMLGGLEHPTAGKLCIQGNDLFAMSEKELEKYRKTKVGFVWQKSGRNLFPYLTLLENVMVPMVFSGKKPDKMWARELLVRVGMGEKMDRYPEQLSGGEQQRAAIAVSLANHPKILLADEPTGAVDSKTSAMLQDLFHELNESLGITIIIVTHDLRLANKVGRMVLLSDGKISTEKIMKEQYKKNLEVLNEPDSVSFQTHEEYAILDRSRRVQLGENMLREAGIDTNRVCLSLRAGEIVIRGVNSNQ